MRNGEDNFQIAAYGGRGAGMRAQIPQAAIRNPQ